MNSDRSTQQFTEDVADNYFIQQCLKPHRGVLIYGPPGTGKSLCMHEIVTLFPNCSVFTLTQDIFLKQYEKMLFLDYLLYLILCVLAISLS